MKRKNLTTLLAVHDDALRNGSYYVNRPGIAGWIQFINGDYVKLAAERPTSYGGQPLKEYTLKEARRIARRP